MTKSGRKIFVRGVPSDKGYQSLEFFGFMQVVPRGAPTLWDFCEQKRVPAVVTLMHLPTEAILAHAFWLEDGIGISCKVIFSRF
jgi:hypothetical protein